MIRNKSTTKIFVAMSGGVDSAVAAALLKKQGFDVAGVSLFLFDGQKETQKKAERVAEKIGIPLRVLDLRKSFQRIIIGDLIREYEKGLTPNPCVRCNKCVKFGLMFREVSRLGGDYLATGHYLKIKKEKAKNKKSEAVYKLFRAKDRKKDQTYFLYNLTQKQLKHLLFPLGNYEKSEIKIMAKEWALPVIEKESYDICFLAGRNIREFLSSEIKAKKGPIKDINSQKIIGEHKGLPFYTIGQRGGLEIGGTGPYYAVKTDYQNNILWVTNIKDDKALLSKELTAAKVNWLAGKTPHLPLRVKAQIRYSHQPAAARISKQGKNYRVLFDKKQKAITPGQSVVFYIRNELVGGGIIR